MDLFHKLIHHNNSYFLDGIYFSCLMNNPFLRMWENSAAFVSGLCGGLLSQPIESVKNQSCVASDHKRVKEIET